MMTTMIHHHRHDDNDDDENHDTDSDCRICWDHVANGTGGLVRPCGHSAFHSQCFAEWKKACVGPCRCPCCNQVVKEYKAPDGSMVAIPWSFLDGQFGIMPMIKVVAFVHIAASIARYIGQDEVVKEMLLPSRIPEPVAEEESDSIMARCLVLFCFFVAFPCMALMVRNWQQHRRVRAVLVVTSAFIMPVLLFSKNKAHSMVDETPEPVTEEEESSSLMGCLVFFCLFVAVIQHLRPPH